MSRGLCNSHANQAKRGRPLTPLRSRQKTTVRDEHDRKRCSTCGEWQDPANFYPNPKTADNLNTYCKRCDRNMRLSRNYGIGVSQYESLLLAQGGGCAICGGAPKDGPSLHVDHDHACCPDRKRSCGSCLRGLLCEDCNRVLGMFRDDVSRFESAIAYLKRGRR
ncbi:endonuclease domain-containing protein [Streptomyces ossamyceticus]|uniref:endonuclease domain-containing protein n=1 Tax=Streptomyces ossamyceticus TaxID=249581 RepID=UPI00196A1A7D|nr:endonuclease domain-containing protein [Streptomyces ossamyceticus]